jgi:hypothetical protein
MPLPILKNLQDLDGCPEWATNIGTTLEPTSIIKARGWVVAGRPPARWQNWWQNATYVWLQKLASLQVSNYETFSNLGGMTSLRSIIYNPELGFWLLTSTTERSHSFDGASWSTPAALAAVSPLATCGFTSGHNMIGLSDGSIDYSVDGYSGWTNQSTGKAEIISAIGTDYPAGAKRTIVGYSDGDLRYSVNGPGGTWLTPATGPTTVSRIVRIVHAAGSTYFLGQFAGETWKTVDGGVNWTATPTQPSSAGLVSLRSIGYNYITGHLIAIGLDSSSVIRIALSEDSGNTWSLANIDFNKLLGLRGVTNVPHDIYWCGGGLWIATIDNTYHDLSSMAFGAVLVSNDDGANWRFHSLPASATGSPSCGAIACDENRLVTVNRTVEEIYRSLSSI